MLICILLILCFSGIACSPYKVRFDRLGGPDAAVGSVKVWVAPEKDWVGYQKRIEDYELRSLRAAVQERAMAPFSEVTKGSFLARAGNPLDVVSSRDAADIELLIEVEALEYGGERELREKMKTFAWFGFLGLAFSGGPEAVMVVSVTAKSTSPEQQEIWSGYVSGRSSGAKSERQAFGLVLEDTANRILAELLHPWTPWNQQAIGSKSSRQ